MSAAEGEKGMVSRFNLESERWERITDVQWVKELIKSGAESLMIANDSWEDRTSKPCKDLILQNFHSKKMGHNLYFYKKVRP